MAKRPRGTRLDKLLEAYEPEVRKAFRESVDNVRNPASIARLVQYIERGDVEAVARELRIDMASFRPLDKALSNAFEAGGNNAARLASAGNPRVSIYFDVRNPTAERIIRNQSANLVREVSDDTRLLIRDKIRLGMERGQNPRTTALDLVGRLNRQTGKREGGAIGLTAAQEGWVQSFTDKLRANDKAALKYELRDKRFDAAILKAIKDGKPLTEDQIRQIAEAYRNKALRYRAEVIARTETLAALNAATMENMRQMIERGEVSEGAIMKVWNSTRDSKVRDTHRALNKSKVPFRADFISPSGARLQFPGDPMAPAEEVINCRCWVSFDIDFFAGLE